MWETEQHYWLPWGFSFFFSYYGSQWCLGTNFLQNIFLKFIQVWNNLRVSKWWQNFHFWVNYPFNKTCFISNSNIWKLSTNFNLLCYNQHAWSCLVDKKTIKQEILKITLSLLCVKVSKYLKINIFFIMCHVKFNSKTEVLKTIIKMC